MQYLSYCVWACLMGGDKMGEKKGDYIYRRMNCVCTHAIIMRGDGGGEGRGGREWGRRGIFITHLLFITSERSERSSY